MKPPPPGQWAPLVVPPSHQEAAARGAYVLCGYGCGRQYLPRLGSRLRGHPACLTELGDDLLMLCERFPRVTYGRLAADVGVTIQVVTRLIQTAMARRAGAARAKDKPKPPPAPRAKRTLTGPEVEMLVYLAGYWRQEGVVPSQAQVGRAMGLSPGTAQRRMEALRDAGWFQGRDLLHVPSCALGCRAAECPTLIRAARGLEGAA